MISAEFSEVVYFYIRVFKNCVIVFVSVMNSHFVCSADFTLCSPGKHVCVATHLLSGKVESHPDHFYASIHHLDG